jgi:hypothetical protein
MTTFSKYLEEHVGPKWVLARRTKRIVAKYGEETVCLSPARMAALERAYERETGFAAYGMPGEPCDALKMAARKMHRLLVEITRDHSDVRSGHPVQRAMDLLIELGPYGT